MLAALSSQFSPHVCSVKEANFRSNLLVVLLCLVYAGLKLDLLRDVRGLMGCLCVREEVAAGWRDSIIITSWRISETEHVARTVHCYGQQT